MALSQVGEYLNDVQDSEPILKTILIFIPNSNSKIRYAAYHSIG